MNWESRKVLVRVLPIIPLEDGSWARVIDGDIFYGSAGNIPIPKDLGLKIVASKAARNKERRALFDNLGVRTADAGMVRARILDVYDRNDTPDVCFKDSLEHLKFLYSTHQEGTEDKAEMFLPIHDHAGRPRCTSEVDFYILDDHPYGAQNMLGTAAMRAFNAFFVHPAYLENAPSTPPGMTMTWVEWMYEYVGVMCSIPLVQIGVGRMSKECLYIVKRRSHSFLGFLKHTWPREGADVANSQAAVAELGEQPVPCVGGARSPLVRCYLPLQELRSECQRFSDMEILPFLDISSSDDANLLSEWSFLVDVLGVRSKNDLAFRTDLLKGFRDSMGGSLTALETSRLLDLYRYIEAWCMGSVDPEAMRAHTFDYIQSARLVIVPSFVDGLDDCEWVGPSDCLWDAPDHFTTKYPLRALYNRAGVDVLDEMEQFFHRTLRIPRMSRAHIIDELGERKEIPPPGIETIRNLYYLLQEMDEEELSIDIETIRASFEESSLVYAKRGASMGWYSPSQCLWSTTTSIEGKVALEGQYPELKGLFIDDLRVPRLSLGMVYDSLVGAASRGVKPAQVKEILLEFNAMLREESTPSKPDRLLQSRVFPVRYPQGCDAALCSCETEFFIADTDDLFATFGDRVRCLDFSLSEVCRLRPLFIWPGLESRYLSRCVEEVSRVRGGLEWPIREPSRDVKRKAYGLLRIAAKWNSPRFHAGPQELYDMLRTAEMVEAEGISSRLVVSQDGGIHEHEVNTSYLHIEDQRGSLKIYVPHDEDEWDDCFFQALPHRLLAWMMTPPGGGGAAAASFDKKAVPMVMAVLNCKAARVPALLKRDGVPDVLEVDEEPLPVPDGMNRTATPTRREYPSGVSSSLDPLPTATVTPERLWSPANGDASYVTPLTDPEDYDSDSDGYGAVSPVDERLSTLSRKTSTEAYRQLLQAVVLEAEKMARREYSSVDAMPALDGLSLDDDDVFSDRVAGCEFPTGSDRYHKIGAVGELFVFELLSNLDPELPAFGRDNWQSTIRYHVNAHPRYRDMASWHGTETSDIVYDDASCVLTALLINKGHLSAGLWADRTARYYIEVKTTPDRCETPFYISGNQAERMLRTTNGPSGSDNQHEIYVVFRVFNLGRESVGLKIYVDPEEQRRTGKLKFLTRAKYTVVPG